MYEIELKAHVTDVQSIKTKLATFAIYKKHIDKSDDYYSYITAPKTSVNQASAADISNNITVRFRRETYNDGTSSTSFCYKQKEVRDGTEVNDERECKVSDSYPLISAFAALGFHKSLHKHKISDFYTYLTPYGLSNIELCNVEGLGNFIEIEILTDSEDPLLIAPIKEQLHKILARCGVSESAIEPRYYKELLAQKAKTGSLV